VDPGSDAADFKGDNAAAAPPGSTYLLHLDHGAFPDSASHPGALVYVPDGFDPTPPIAVVAYIHGFYNCVENVVRSTGQPCHAGGPARMAYALTAQLEASKKNALLVIPEVAYEQANADPGQLGTDGGFSALLGEVLSKLTDLGPLSLDDVGTVIVASHSGGYKAAAGIAQRGGLPVSEIFLLDSLYGATADFDAWVQADPDSLAGDAPTRRFADIYTTYGGTLANSQAMASRAGGWVDASALANDPTTSTWSLDHFRHGLVFKHSSLAHDSVPRYYFVKLLETSSLPDKP
jgi:hypothetical protein